MDRKISICVALNLKSIKRGWGVPLRFYYLLRFLDDGGCGKIELSDAVDILSEKLRQSKQNVRTILRKRGGVFWYVYGKRIYLNAIEKVAEEIGLESLGERIALYEQELTDKLTKFKARAIYSIAARDSGRSFDIHPKTGKVENKGLSTHFDPDALYRGLQWRLRDEYFGTPKVDFFYGPSKD